LKRESKGIDEVHENKLVHRDGSSLWVFVNSKSFFDKDGRFAGVLAMLTDITERKKAEFALKETLDNLEDLVIERTFELENAYKSLKVSEEKYRCIVETAGEGIWITDPEAVTTFVNQRMAEMPRMHNGRNDREISLQLY